ncbi:hypothetical protein MNBD_ALPHA04-486, partial [hydrothermal vent metagenome]
PIAFSGRYGLSYKMGGIQMVTTKWNGAVITESDETAVVDGNHYFPRNTIKFGFLADNGTISHCPWKGVEVSV